MPRPRLFRLLLRILLAAPISVAAGNPGPDKAEMQRQADREHERQQRIQQRKDSLRQAEARKRYDVLKIDREPDACVVFRTDDFRCLLDVRAFNRMADIRVQSTLLPETDASREGIHARRLAIVEPLLESAYLDHIGETHADRRMVASDSRRQVESVFSKGGETLSDSLLRAAYQLHAARFQGGIRLRLDILASTDSSLIDSLLSALSAEAPGAGPRKRPGNIRPYSLTLVQDGGKPVEPAGFEDIFVLAKGAPPEKWVRPPPRKYGHVLFKVRNRDSLPPVRFQEARPLLSYLASLPDAGAPAGPGEEARLLKHYEANRTYFLHPDTLFFKVWLWPFQTNASDPGGQPGTRAMDTGSIAPMTLTQFDFPAPLRIWVYENFRCCPGNRWSPSGLPFGKWSFHLQRIARGKGIKPFAAVRDSLREILSPDRDPYLEAERVLRSKARTKEQYVWRETILDDLRARSRESARAPEGLMEEYRKGIRAWVSESLDLTALEE